MSLKKGDINISSIFIGAAENLSTELADQDTLITSQETAIDTIITALEGKAAGGETITKGIIIKDRDENQYPTNIYIVGLTEIPGRYLYQAGYYNNSSNRGWMSGTNNKITISAEAVTLKSYCFRYNQSTIEMILEGPVTKMESYVFAECTKLEKIIFKGLTSVPALSANNNFASSSITSGTGYVYVPDDLVDDIKVATNWSVIADQIKPLSELE